MNDQPHVDDVRVPAGDDEDEAIVEDGGEGHTRPRRNDYEDFVAGLPAGFCVCPMCLAVGAVIEDPPFDPRTHVCYTCLGYGEVRTGSVVTGNVTRKCDDCEGRGWVNNDPSEPIASPAVAADVEAGAVTVDYAGRTPDDPEFDWSRVTRDDGTRETAPAPA